MNKKSLKIFVSSPGDVAEERALSERVTSRLKNDFAHRVEITPIFWEHEPLRATESFQDGLPLPSETDIVISILWTRLGTLLPRRYKEIGEELPPTGTEFEIKDAMRAYEAYGSPDLLIYKRLWKSVRKSPWLTRTIPPLKGILWYLFVTWAL